MKTSTKISKIATTWDNADKWVKRVLGVIATIGTIAAIITGITGWVTNQLDSHLDPKLENLVSQIEELRAESEKADKTLELSNTRLELTTLIAHNPDNVLEIEKVARYYFIELFGDWYMSQIYSTWAREYGGDLTFVTHI